jgi:hypothetical protein
MLQKAIKSEIHFFWKIQVTVMNLLWPGFFFKIDLVLINFKQKAELLKNQVMTFTFFKKIHDFDFTQASYKNM